VWGDIEFIEADIRDGDAVKLAVSGVESVCHLAFVNGTEFFYKQPELVLDVGVKGMVNVLDACLSASVGELMLASSSEVYQTPPVVPTDETVPLSIPDPLNPRYSYAAGKIISEIMALNAGRSGLGRVIVIRPHNVYGPDMGWEHVIPQFVVRMKVLAGRHAEDPIRFPIQGSGQETRAFVFVDDFIDAWMLLLEQGAHRGIYHVGTMDEQPMSRVAHLTAQYFGRVAVVQPGEPARGGTLRRCPDTTKLSLLGYRPRYSFEQGLPIVAKWYDEHSHLAPRSSD